MPILNHQTAPERPIFLIAYYNSHLPQFLLLAQFIQTKEDFSAVLVFQNDIEPISISWYQKFNQLGVHIIDRWGQPLAQPAEAVGEIKRETTPPSVSAGKGFIKRIPGAVAVYEWLFLKTYGWRDGLAYYRKLRRYSQAARRLLVEFNPALIFLPEENAQIATMVYTKNAQRLHIGSIVTPYTIADVTEFAASDYDQKNLWITGGWKNLLAKVWPQWTYTHESRRLSLQSWPRIMAMELLRLAPPMPGMINSGFADLIVVESRHMMQYYRDRALPPEKLKLIGSLSDDALAAVRNDVAARRARLYQDYHLPPEKPLLVCALPPQWILRPQYGFRTHDDVIQFWMECLQTVKNYSIIIHLHPRLSYAALRSIETDRLKIALTDITNLIPLCDLFVASISATIRWAIACGKPVINYDVNHYGLHDYDGVPGVLTMDTKEEFASTLHRVTTDQSYFNSLVQQQHLEQKDWGILDGRSGERLWQTMAELMNES